MKREAKQRAAEKNGEKLDPAEDIEMPDVANTLKLAEILGAGGLPKVARLDVSLNRLRPHEADTFRPASL